MTIGERIRKLREGRHLTQQQLADRVRVAKPTVSLWESGGRIPSRDSIEALCSVFNVDMDYMMGRQKVSMRYLDTVELDLIDAFRRMSEDQQELVCRMCGIELKRDVKSQNLA